MTEEVKIDVNEESWEKILSIKTIVDQTSKSLAEALLLDFSFNQFNSKYKKEPKTKDINKVNNKNINENIDKTLKNYENTIKEIDENSFNKNKRKKIRDIQHEISISFMNNIFSNDQTEKFKNTQNTLKDKYKNIITKKLKQIAEIRSQKLQKENEIISSWNKMTKEQKNMLTQYYSKIYNTYSLDYNEMLKKTISKNWNMGKILWFFKKNNINNLENNNDDDIIKKLDSLIQKKYEGKDEGLTESWDNIYTETSEINNNLIKYIDESLFFDNTLNLIKYIKKFDSNNNIKFYEDIAKKYGKELYNLDTPKTNEYKLGPSKKNRENYTITPIEAFACLHNCLNCLTEDFKDETRVLQSSTSMFLIKENYNHVPWDVDVCMSRNSFHRMWDKIKTKNSPVLARLKNQDVIKIFDHSQEGKPEICKINKSWDIVWNESYNRDRIKPKTKNNNDMINNFDKLIDIWNIVMTYDIYDKNDIWMNIEVFSEWPKNKAKDLNNTWFVQPEEKKKWTDKIYSSLYKDKEWNKLEFVKKNIPWLDSEDKYTDCMSEEMLSKFYIINLVHEVVLWDRVDTTTTKIKYWTRLRNLYYHLKEVWITTNNIIEKISETTKYFFDQWKRDWYAKQALDARYWNSIKDDKNYKNTIKKIIKSLENEKDSNKYKDKKNLIINITNLYSKSLKKIIEEANDKENKQIYNIATHNLKYANEFLEQLNKIKSNNDINKLVEMPHFASFFIKAISWYNNQKNIDDKKNNYYNKFDQNLINESAEIISQYKFLVTPPWWELLGEIKKEFEKIISWKKEKKPIKEIDINNAIRQLTNFNYKLIRHKTELKNMYNNISKHRLEKQKWIEDDRILISIMKPRLEAIKKQITDERESLLKEKDIHTFPDGIIFEYVASYHIFLKYYYNSFYSMLIKEDEITKRK